MHRYKSVVSCAFYKMGEYKIYLKGLDRVRKTDTQDTWLANFQLMSHAQE